MPARPLSPAVSTLAARDPDLGNIVDRHGAPPIWARRPGYATLTRIILEQQVSLASGAAAYKRLQGVVGRVTPARVQAAGEGRLRRAGLTRQKAAYCHGLAADIVSGRVSLAHIAGADDDTARAMLMTIRGIGLWTADIYLLMALGRPDVWPRGDLALAVAMQRVKRLRAIPDAAKQDRVAASWTPWRSVAARLLWHHYLAVKRGMIDWVRDHETLMWWLVAGSVVAFVGSLILVPILVVRIPADYFSHDTRHHTPWVEHHPIVRVLLLGLKNILGAILVAGGVAMLVLPGQGLLTLAMGLMLIDFPGKYRFERWLVSRRPVLRAINWLRRRSGHTPLTIGGT